ncbi:MAG: aminopeptidase P family protein [Rhodomicrobium sp.]|nr:aminopeptidase P family protein [Rhodomicrobium sp.]
MQKRQNEAHARLEALRAELRASGLSGFIVPKGDEFQNEYVPAYADRLAWLTGFTGSAGTAVILEDKAALIVDSRYTLQAKAQAGDVYAVELFPKTTVTSYLAANAPKGAAIGYDPALHTLKGFKQLRQEAVEKGLRLTPCRRNPVDRIWKKRPKPSHAPIFIQEEAFAGESAASKLERVQKAIKEKGAAGLFACAPDNVAWLFNIRGRDVVHTPLPLVRAYVPASGKPAIFTSPGHITPENSHAVELLATIANLASLSKVLPSFVEAGAKVMIDPERATFKIAAALKACKASLLEASDPCTLFKARKNKAELEGARNAQIRDGEALCRFLTWLDGEAPAGHLDEIAASDRLEAFRRETDMLEDLSFDTISGAGSNGAIVHYRVTPETNKKLLPGTLYLIDSGGQYRDGTTDVTRTVAVGEPTDEMRRHYTLVLKGHIGIATARFPAGTRGMDIDGFARRALWAAGLDYGHGTGHGIGSFLSVHEGPQSISRNGMAALEPGMIVSNEPGYYREGHYGIRLENLLAVRDAEPVEGGETPMLGFETLTLAPFDRRLIAAELLSQAELSWLNDYHERVFAALKDGLPPKNRHWLKLATQAIRAPSKAPRQAASRPA